MVRDGAYWLERGVYLNVAIYLLLQLRLLVVMVGR